MSIFILSTCHGGRAKRPKKGKGKPCMAAVAATAMGDGARRTIDGLRAVVAFHGVPHNGVCLLATAVDPDSERGGTTSTQIGAVQGNS
ncbi:flavodoxin family protein [Sesbania bispinosa]|nr:flavodoxin family protein [Sesbania bispinosa]